MHSGLMYFINVNDLHQPNSFISGMDFPCNAKSVPAPIRMLCKLYLLASYPRSHKMVLSLDNIQPLTTGLLFPSIDNTPSHFGQLVKYVSTAKTAQHNIDFLMYPNVRKLLL